MLKFDLPQEVDLSDPKRAVAQLWDRQVAFEKQVAFYLRNLDVENFNEQGLEGITEPVYKTIGDVEGKLLKVEATAEGASVTARDAQGSAAQAQLTAEGASLVASNAAGQAASLAFTVDGLTVRNPDGSTTIDGNKIKSGTIEGVTLISSNNKGDKVEISDGNIYVLASGGEASGGINTELGEIVLYSTWPMNAPLRIRNTYGRVEISALAISALASGNLSVSAGSDGTLYLGTYNGGCNVDIGYEGKDIHLYGNVYINGVLQG